MPYVANVAPATREPPTLASRHACAIDIDHGWVLYTKDAQFVTDWPASTVKMMTCLLIAELKASVLDSETVTWQTSDDIDPSFSQIGLANGDIVTWRALLIAGQMASGGDAMQAAARVLGNEDAGNALTSTAGYAAFVEMMNARAAQLGMNRTTFVNSDGRDRHKINARDLAVLAGAAFGNAAVADAAGRTTYGVSVTGPSPRTINLTRTNTFSGDSGVIGSKTGTLIISGDVVTTYTLGSLWQAPSGDRVALATLGGPTDADRLADNRAMVAALVADFPYLDP